MTERPATPRLVGRRADVSGPGLSGAVTDLVADCAPDLDEALVVPDCHYPFHPSTGMVTNPDVVEALVEALAASADVTLALPDSEWVQNAPSMLGYEDVADRTGADTLALGEAETVERVVRTDDERHTVTVPAPLDERPVVAVPTLRADPDLAAAMVTVAEAATGSRATTDVVAASAVVDPDFVLLDGTYTYTGAPHRARFLVAGTDAPAVDRAVAPVAGLKPKQVPYLRPFGVGREAIEGLHAEDLAAELPHETTDPNGGEMPEIMGTGFRLYAKVTGDLVPPQFTGGSDD
ncbi:hypothetical protein [Halomarina oriensis]|uniref:DUF362 domain-containing protein n=1 Tax=Halomarina oriensis TaxID=671145 RepID=A0A6B0GK68_9EURY|nr:hypothetical protein [Halomarina oriensis]MWG33193.1 hypothetical protein [Halomarina oriensis]